MSKLTLDDLKFPFHIINENTDKDLTFSYHVSVKEDSLAYMCNDIPCSMCPFECKQGENRAQVLAEFAKENFPELFI